MSYGKRGTKKGIKMHIVEYLKKIKKFGQSSDTHLFLNNNVPLLKETPFLDFSGIKYIDTLCLNGYDYNLVLSDLEEVRDLEIPNYNKSLQADKFKKATTLGLSGCKSDISLPSFQSTYNLAIYNFSNRLNVPRLKTIGQLYFDNKTQLTLASGQKIVGLKDYKKEKGFGTNYINAGDFGDSVNTQARDGIYNVYGKTVYLCYSYYAYTDHVARGIYEIIWNSDVKILLMQNGGSHRFIMLSGNKFFEGGSISECREKYNNWKNTTFINNLSINRSMGITILPNGKTGQEFYITAFYSDGTLAASNEPVGMDEKIAYEKFERLQNTKQLRIEQFNHICLEGR